jgi:hypothetical protein
MATEAIAGGVRPLLWTRAEYDRMADAGLLGDGRRLHAYADPIGGGRYGEHDEHGEADSVALPWPAEPIAVADLLPPAR